MALAGSFALLWTTGLVGLLRVDFVLLRTHPNRKERGEDGAPGSVPGSGRWGSLTGMALVGFFALLWTTGLVGRFAFFG